MPLNIAILGTRGVPNNYGGFEHFAEHLATGLIKKGHRATVYNSARHPYQMNEWRGARIVHCYDPENIIGIAGQFIYDLHCLLHARKQSYDVILILGYTSSSIWKFVYPRNAVVITNMDGMEWQRTKYSKLVRSFLRYAEKLAIRSCRYHVADSPVIKKYLDAAYGINCKYIAYGADPHPASHERFLESGGLRKGKYFLLMARMEPENNIEMILDGFHHTHPETTFAVIGNMQVKYGKHLLNKYKNDKRIIFLGGIFNEGKVQSLVSNCKLYFHGHSVGGTNPSLLGAMAARVPIAAHLNPFTQTILKQNAVYFSNSTDGRRIIIEENYSDKTKIHNNYSAIVHQYNWEMIIEQYENYLMSAYAETHGHMPVVTAKPVKEAVEY